MHTPHSVILAAIVALTIGVSASACSFGNTDLLPLEYGGATVSEDGGWAERTADGVTLRATPRWDGDDDVLQHLTPIHVVIRNGSGRALQLRYGAISARTLAHGKRGALPVIHYDHEDATDGLSSQRALKSDGFAVFRHASDEYPGVPVASQRRAKPDEAYHNRHDRFLERLPVKLEDRVYVEALPEGVLEDGGTVEGFVYFVEIEDDLDAIGKTAENPRVAVILELVDIETGDPFGQVELAFEID